MIELVLVTFLVACNGDAFPTSISRDAIVNAADAAPTAPESPSRDGDVDPANPGIAPDDPAEIRGQLVAIEVPDNILTAEGATRQLSATFRYQSGATRPDGKVKWVSADPKVAMIDADGFLTAVSAGSTEIFASALGSKSAIKVQVSSSSVASIELNETSLTLLPGQSFQLWADLQTRSGDLLRKKINWSTSNPDVADVDSGGLVTALALGASVVTAKSGGAVATATVLVVAQSGDGGSAELPETPAPEGVSDLVASSGNDHSATLRLTQVDDGSGSPANYVVRFAPPSIDWSQASDVTKGSCAGSVIGSSIGSSLTCTVDGLQPSTAYEFQVASYRGTLGSDAVFGPLSNVAATTTEDSPVFVAVTPSEATLKKGGTKKLDAEVTDAFGNPVSGYTVSWSSTKSTVASVDQSGLVAAKSAGNASIKASISGDSDAASVTVEEATEPPPPPPPDTTSPPPPPDSSGTTAASVELSLSLSPDRSGAVPLNGETLSGDAYVFLDVGDVVVDSVIFMLDGHGVRRDILPPYDLTGGTDSEATAWDTREVADGPHDLRAVTYGDGQAEATADFSVDNSTSGSDTTSTSGSDGTSSPPSDTTPPPPPPPGTLVNPFRAFPEAEGWGAEALTTCDRSRLQVLRVTNLENGGAGSLRDAISRVDNTVLSVVVFDVGGYITLSNAIGFKKHRCLYIAGQTAPGDGITLRAPDQQVFFLNAERDVVIRYLRLRNGTNQPGVNTTSQGMIIASGVNVIIDHLSFSWANDQLLSIYRYPADISWAKDVNRITVQRTFFAEPFKSSPVCYSVKGNVRDDENGIPQWYEVDRITFHHNLSAHCSHRSPWVDARFAEVINTVVYNWNQGALSNNRKSWTDFIGNYLMAGPANRSLSDRRSYEIQLQFVWTTPEEKWRASEPDGYVLLGNTNNIDGRAGPAIYVEGNIGPRNPSGALDNWVLVDTPEVVEGVRLRRDAPLPWQPPFPVRVESAVAAWNSLVEQGDVGANRRLTCGGDWTPMADAVDQRVLRDARSGTSSPFSSYSEGLASQDQVGGFPSLASGTPCADSDQDGMPDDFETRYGLNLSDPNDNAADPDGDGYTNLEEYLNGTRPR